MPIIIGDSDYELDIEADVYNWKTHPKKCPKTTDGNPRKSFARAVMVHTVHGTADGDVAAWNHDPSDEDLKYAKYQAGTTREVSWHFTLDVDGSIAQSADPATWVCWHGNQTNPFTIGIELVQASKGDLTDVQMKSFVALMDLLTRVDHPLLCVQRQTPFKDGKPYRGMLSRLLTEQGSGRTVPGIYGHRNTWYRSKTGVLKPYRGAGDPGDAPFLALKDAGYELLDMEANEDLQLWKTRQAQLGLPDDGLPGPATRAAIKAKLNKPHGVWVPRASD
jgi:hypothetical protein